MNSRQSSRGRYKGTGGQSTVGTFGWKTGEYGRKTGEGDSGICFLDILGIEYKRVDHEPAFTMEVCEEIDKMLQATICKNSFPVQSSEDTVLSVDDAGRQAVKTKRSLHRSGAQDCHLHRLRHGEISGYRTGGCQCHGTDE